MKTVKLTRKQCNEILYYGENYLRSEVMNVTVPIIPNLDKKILDKLNKNGELDMDNWHGKLDMNNWHGNFSHNQKENFCGTTHCRGGWAIVLGGEIGFRLEKRIGVEDAAALIYHCSTGKIPSFYCSNKNALADIKECAMKRKKKK